MAAPGEATAAEMPGASTNTGGSGGYEPDTTASRENVYLLCYSFNQDSSCFVCGTTAGFRVFSLDTYKDDSNGDGTAIRERLRRDPHPHPRSSVMRVAMLMRSSIFAMVNQTFETSGEPAPGCMNKVQIWEERKQKVVAELRCRNEVKSVALHKDIIVMVCEYVIYVYTSGDVKVILHLDTGSNKLGLCAVATGSDPWLLCCPAQNKGAIRIQCGQDATATHVFQAHQSGVACLELSASGSLVATASETGTVMKVFRTKDGEALYRLRRSTRPAVISSLAFGGPDDCYLAVASSSVTVHIFKLDNAMVADVEEKENASPALEPQPDPKWTGPLSAMQTLQSKATPMAFSERLEQVQDSDDDIALLQSPEGTLPRRPLDGEIGMELLQAVNSSTAVMGYWQKLGADVKDEGVFQYFATRGAFWIGLSASIIVMSVLNIFLCPTSGEQLVDETFGSMAEAWVPIHKAPKFVGSPVQSPFFGTSPYHARGYMPGSPSSYQESSISPTSSPGKG